MRGHRRPIARLAEVSVETIKQVVQGSKPGLVQAIRERGLAPSAFRPAPHRSIRRQRASDPRALIREWGKLTAEVAPLVAPILLLVRAAAHSDGELAALLKDSDEKRHARMGQNARSLKARGFLRDGITVEKATDVMWTVARALRCAGRAARMDSPGADDFRREHVILCCSGRPPKRPSEPKKPREAGGCRKRREQLSHAARERVRRRC